MWWIIEIALSLILYTAGTAVYHHWGEATEHVATVSKLASDTAIIWDQFADALDAYVHANLNNRNGVPPTITCADLQKAGYLSTTFGDDACTDPVGEKLVGYVASPWGFPQSWMVLAANAPSSKELTKYGFSNGSGEASAQASAPPPNSWESFAMQVAGDAVRMEQQGGYTGAVMQTDSMPNPGAFMIPASSAGFNSKLSQYFPSNGVTQPQTTPAIHGYDGYAIMLAPALQLNPGYWLFNAQMVTGSGTSSITWTNEGYSPTCPAGNGLTPGMPPTDWTLDCTNSNGSVTAPHGRCFTQDTAETPLYQNEDVCIPANKSFVDAQNLPSLKSTNYFYPPYMVSKNGVYWIGSQLSSAESSNAPLGTQVIYIKIGKTLYTIIDYVGDAGGFIPGAAWFPYVEMLAVWIGEPTANQYCPGNGSVFPCFQPSVFGSSDGMSDPKWGLPSVFTPHPVALN